MKVDKNVLNCGIIFTNLRGCLLDYSPAVHRLTAQSQEAAPIPVVGLNIHKRKKNYHLFTFHLFRANDG